MKIGFSWVPDYVEVTHDPEETSVSIVIIELEATEGQARISSRKYLPESCINIATTFMAYLDRVLQICQSTADSRIEPIQRLRDALDSSHSVAISTAAALRSAGDFVEHLPLIDCPLQTMRPVLRLAAAPVVAQRDWLGGELVVSRADRENLVRAILLVDFVVQDHHSDATLRTWVPKRKRKFCATLGLGHSELPGLYPILHADARSAMRADLTLIAKDLVSLWLRSQISKLNVEQTVQALAHTFEIGCNYRGHESTSSALLDVRSYIQTILDRPTEGSLGREQI